MPTIISHAVVPLAIGLGLGSNIISRRLIVAGMIASIAPDFDVIAFKIGLAYGHAWGHRGATHSFAFALALGLFAALLARQLRTKPLSAFIWISMAAASHGLLDMLTNGGLGVAIEWPFSDVRHFFETRPIQVSPLTLERLFSERGIAVMRSELIWVWLPACCGFLVLLGARLVGRSR